MLDRSWSFHQASGNLPCPPLWENTGLAPWECILKTSATLCPALSISSPSWPPVSLISIKNEWCHRSNVAQKREKPGPSTHTGKQTRQEERGLVGQTNELVALPRLAYRRSGQCLLSYTMLAQKQAAPYTVMLFTEGRLQLWIGLRGTNTQALSPSTRRHPSAGGWALILG